MNSGSPARNLVFNESSRTTAIAGVIVTALVLSALDDLRVAVATHRSGSAMIWMVATYVFSVIALPVSYTHLTLPTKA